MMEDTIRLLEAELRDAQLNADVDALDRLIDDALLFTGPDGRLVTKADDLALHRSGAVRFSTHIPSDLQWQQVTPAVVVVTLRARLGGLFHGQSFAGDYRYTRVWAQRDHSWRVVAGHVSTVALPSPDSA
ncbi:nuclear transport factor 2 family protein [Gemmatimonas sp.]|uniref:nuclear transport factor 2 family protein n=1 Tax=Gemmatimonas sp. TaxID=1962908 RepID=UPI003982E354